MSHEHSHGPGQSHSHSHSHGPPQQAPQQQQQQQQLQVAPADPVVQAMIDAQFAPVPLKLSGKEGHLAVCPVHELEKCRECGVDYEKTNRIAKLLFSNPGLLCPPPPAMVSKNLSAAVTAVKDEGNNLFRGQHNLQAIARYNMAANIAVQRPQWESNNILREELAAVLSNRSAAYVASGDPISGLADADAVIALKKPWPKGHFRKAKALLAMGRLEDAKDAVGMGLAFEPNNQELEAFLTDIERVQQNLSARKEQAKSAKEAVTGSPSSSNNDDGVIVEKPAS